MKSPSLTVLVIDEEQTLTLAVRDALEQRGHQVLTVESAEAALQLPPPDVLVSDMVLRGITGLELLTILEERAPKIRAVFLSSKPVNKDSSRERIVGKNRFLSKPFRIEELLRAVEREPVRPALPCEVQDEFTEEDYFAAYAALSENVDQAARDLAAYALRADVGPTCRARIATALCEIFDNARRHAYPDGNGLIQVRAEIDDRDLVVSVTDQGIGFDSVAASAEFLHGSGFSGLARASSLAEDLRIESKFGAGTQVSMRFAASRVDFDEMNRIDMTEMDFFTPEIARRVLEAVRSDHGESIFHFSPALAVIVGRMLSGPDPKLALQNSLWT